MNTITTTHIPIRVQGKINIPVGKIEGVFKVYDEDDEWLVITVLSYNSRKTRDMDIYVIPNGTDMNSVDSLGRFFGTFCVKGFIYHVYEQLYIDS